MGRKGAWVSCKHGVYYITLISVIVTGTLIFCSYYFYYLSVCSLLFTLATVNLVMFLSLLILLLYMMAVIAVLYGYEEDFNAC